MTSQLDETEEFHEAIIELIFAEGNPNVPERNHGKVAATAEPPSTRMATDRLAQEEGSKGLSLGLMPIGQTTRFVQQ